MSGSEADRPPSIVLLGAPLPPPYGGIAKYLQRAIPSLIARGYRIRAIQPPSELTASPLAVPASPMLMLDRVRFSGSVATIRFALSRLRGLAPILVRYLPALLRHPRFAAREVYGFLSWCMSADAACQRDGPKVIHAYDYPWSQGAAALWAARRWGARCLVSTFGEVVPHRDELNQVDTMSAPFRGVTRYVLRRADGVASMTQHCRNQVRYVGVDPAQVALVRFVVGMESFHPDVNGTAIRERYARTDGPLLLFVGQLRPRKGPQTLVKAMPAVLAHHPDARLLMVGPDHGYGSELRAMAKQLGVAAAIDCIGAVPDNELPVYYAACDVFLFPTLTPIECLGLSFIQAMFAARPVIATRIAGAPEVIRDGIDGYLVAPGNAAAFADRIDETLRLSREHRAALGIAARARALELFDEADVLGDVIRFYESALGRHPVPV